MARRPGQNPARFDARDPAVFGEVGVTVDCASGEEAPVVSRSGRFNDSSIFMGLFIRKLISFGNNRDAAG